MTTLRDLDQRAEELSGCVVAMMTAMEHAPRGRALLDGLHVLFSSHENAALVAITAVAHLRIVLQAWADEEGMEMGDLLRRYGLIVAMRGEDR